MVPIYQTSTYAQEGLGKHKGYEYARTQNPTREALEENLAALEGGTHGFAFASGLAATTTLLHLLKAGDHVVASNNIYGGTYRLFEQVFTHLGMRFTYVDSADLAAVEAAHRAGDEAGLRRDAHQPADAAQPTSRGSRRSRSATASSAPCDNTFATPIFQRPLELGADIVLHSTTKYLNGHSDMVGGALVVKRDDLATRLRFLQNAVGAVPGPLDCWLALRGIKTLPLRMERHQRNAGELAAWLVTQAAGARGPRVIYPGLPDHPGHALAKQQMAGFGGIISLDFPDLESGKRFCEALRLFTLGESLGGVESLVTHPATMTHASVPKAQREATGFTDGLVRLSVGCEDVADLREDLARGLAAVAGAHSGAPSS